MTFQFHQRAGRDDQALRRSDAEGPAAGLAVARVKDSAIDTVGNQRRPALVDTELEGKLTKPLGNGNHQRGAAERPCHSQPAHRFGRMIDLAATERYGEWAAENDRQQSGGNSFGISEMSVN